MARALVIGCGCRGRLLAAALSDRGWSVRGTSRTEAGARAIEDHGLEGVIADPVLPGTILDHVHDVALVVHLLGAVADANGSAVHAERLSSLLHRLVDTPVRAFAYEPGGGAAATAGEVGTTAVREAGRTWSIPYSILPLRAEASWSAWAEAAARSALEPLDR